MAQPVVMGPDLRSALAGAYGVTGRRSGVAGTEHLLLGLVAATDTGPLARVLAAAGLTRPVVVAALRRHDGHWRHDDRADGELPLGPLDRVFEARAHGVQRCGARPRVRTNAVDLAIMHDVTSCIVPFAPSTTARSTGAS